MKSWLLFALVLQALYAFSSAAIPSLCSKKPDPGLCMAYFPRYFHNSTSGRCEQFVYGGCQGNANNFETLEDCEHTCTAVKKNDCPKFCPLIYRPVCGSDGKTYPSPCNLKAKACDSGKKIEIEHEGKCEDKDICLLPKEPGLCMAYFENYYYNADSGKCEKFVYGGCMGNRNNFETLEDCESHCP